jgi:hypothetical protein
MVLCIPGHLLDGLWVLGIERCGAVTGCVLVGLPQRCITAVCHNAALKAQEQHVWGILGGFTSLTHTLVWVCLCVRARLEISAQVTIQGGGTVLP